MRSDLNVLVVVLSLASTGCKGNGVHPPDALAVDASISDGSTTDGSFHCVEPFSAEIATETQQSLPEALAVKWEQTYPSTGLKAGIVATASRLAFTAGNRLIILDHSGGVVSVNFGYDGEALSSPVADDAGNLYVAGDLLYKVAINGDLSSLLGLGAFEMGYPSGAGPIIGDEIYVAGHNGMLSAISDTGAIIWQSPITNPGDPAASLVAASLVAISTSRGIFDSANGSRLGTLTIAQVEYYLVAFGNGVFWGVSQEMPSGAGHLARFDRCGSPEWVLDHSAILSNVIVGINGDLYFEERSEDTSTTATLAAYSADGARINEISVPSGGVVAQGADGLVYVLECSPAALVAYSPALVEQARVAISACPNGEVVLTPEGIMYMVGAGPSGTTVYAVQTTSPGPANGTRALTRNDEHRSGWVSGVSRP
jgi:hypothetical protein